jgi:meiotically up-regulated gene 157 (Mug157) protein
MKRRTFIRTSALATAGISLTNPGLAIISSRGFESKRPPLKKRTFVSDTVEAFVSQVKTNIPDAEIGWLFENCFPNTLDTTIRYSEPNGKPDTFVITGDIPAMWLRDSTCQIWPYLQLINEDPKLKKLIQGVINRQVNSVLLDPYANAFLFDKNEKSQWLSDHTTMQPGVHERKFEIDSLCYVIRLSYGYWKATNDISIFDENWHKAMKRIIEVFHRQQKRKGNNSEYSFSRNSDIPTETLANSGNGRIVNPVGLICSPFRPSDDATTFQFSIPSNFFALQTLRNLDRIYHKYFPTDPLTNEIGELSSDLLSALIQYGVVSHPIYGKIYAYEVDGYGSIVLQDEPNIPNLTSLPYLGCVPNNDQIYQNTRKFIFSNSNPYFLKGTAAEGIGSPHTPPNYIWHLGIMMQALTSENNAEIANCIKMLKATHAGTGFMHEGFDKDNPAKYTRPWFSWANSLFGELIVKTWKTSPELLA